MAAIQRVLGIYELAEAILLQLTLYDLVLTAVVCKQWWQIISTSTSIRNRLLNDRIPAFAPYESSSLEPDDLCNSSKDSPWFFRTNVQNGIVIVFRVKNANVHLYIPNDRHDSIQHLDATRTEGAFHINYKVRCGWANFFDVYGNLVCCKTTWRSPWLWPVEKPDSIWDYVKKFNAKQNEQYRLWLDSVCKRDDWDRFFAHLNDDKGK